VCKNKGNSPKFECARVPLPETDGAVSSSGGQEPFIATAQRRKLHTHINMVSMSGCAIVHDYTIHCKTYICQFNVNRSNVSGQYDFVFKK